jgi:hypothetical protein
MNNLTFLFSKHPPRRPTQNPAKLLAVLLATLATLFPVGSAVGEHSQTVTWNIPVDTIQLDTGRRSLELMWKAGFEDGYGVLKSTDLVTWEVVDWFDFCPNPKFRFDASTDSVIYTDQLSGPSAYYRIIAYYYDDGS